MTLDERKSSANSWLSDRIRDASSHPGLRVMALRWAPFPSAIEVDLQLYTDSDGERDLGTLRVDFDPSVATWPAGQAAMTSPFSKQLSALFRTRCSKNESRHSVLQRAVRHAAD